MMVTRAVGTPSNLLRTISNTYHNYTYYYYYYYYDISSTYL